MGKLGMGLKFLNWHESKTCWNQSAHNIRLWGFIFLTMMQDCNLISKRRENWSTMWPRGIAPPSIQHFMRKYRPESTRPTSALTTRCWNRFCLAPSTVMLAPVITTTSSPMAHTGFVDTEMVEVADTAEFLSRTSTADDGCRPCNIRFSATSRWLRFAHPLFQQTHVGGQLIYRKMMFLR